MVCDKCGSQLPEDAKFCGDCGNVISNTEVVSGETTEMGNEIEEVSVESTAEVNDLVEGSGVLEANDDNEESADENVEDVNSDEANADEVESLASVFAVKKSKKKMIVWSSIAGAAVIVIAASLFFVLNYTNLFSNVNKSPEAVAEAFLNSVYTEDADVYMDCVSDEDAKLVLPEGKTKKDLQDALKNLNSALKQNAGEKWMDDIKINSFVDVPSEDGGPYQIVNFEFLINGAPQPDRVAVVSVEKNGKKLWYVYGLMAQQIANPAAVQ